jgi:hypothetical protein
MATQAVIAQAGAGAADIGRVGQREGHAVAAQVGAGGDEEVEVEGEGLVEVQHQRRWRIAGAGHAAAGRRRQDEVAVGEAVARRVVLGRGAAVQRPGREVGEAAGQADPLAGVGAKAGGEGEGGQQSGELHGGVSH